MPVLTNSISKFNGTSNGRWTKAHFKGLLVMLLLTVTSTIQAQVKIGEDPKIINEGSILELQSEEHGLLFTRVEVNDLEKWTLKGTKVDGMVIYNTSADHPNGLYVWFNEKWNLAGTNADDDQPEEAIIVKEVTNNFTFDVTTGDLIDNSTTITITGTSGGDHLILIDEQGHPISVYVWSVVDEGHWESISTFTSITNIVNENDYETIYDETTNSYKITYNGDEITNFYNGDYLITEYEGNTITLYWDSSTKTWNEFYTNQDNDKTIEVTVNSLTDIFVYPTINEGYSSGDIIKKTFNNSYVTYALIKKVTSENDVDVYTYTWIEIARYVSDEDNNSKQQVYYSLGDDDQRTPFKDSSDEIILAKDLNDLRAQLRIAGSEISLTATSNDGIALYYPVNWGSMSYSLMMNSDKFELVNGISYSTIEIDGKWYKKAHVTCRDGHTIAFD